MEIQCPLFILCLHPHKEKVSGTIYSDSYSTLACLPWLYWFRASIPGSYSIFQPKMAEFMNRRLSDTHREHRLSRRKD